MLRKCTSILLTAVFALSLCLAARAADPAGIPVRVRVENSAAGSAETLLPTTLVYLSPSENTAYWALTKALSAKLGADNDALIYETGDYGMYIISLMGAAQDDACSWMYAVNDATPWVSFDQCTLESGDTVVFYFIDWQAATYSYFDKPMVMSDIGAAITLTLLTNTWEDAGIPVEGATILIDGEPSEFVTGADGKVQISLPEEKTYALSASLTDEDGNETISRPSCDAIIAPIPMNGAETVLNVSTRNGGVFLNWTGLDVPVRAFSQGGTVYVPLRAVATALKGEVGWNPETREASVTFGGREYTCRTDEAVDGAFPMIVHERMMVPAGLIEGIFGVKVNLLPM